MKIRLSDVARVKNAEMLLDGITVVAGSNGCGKSTISKSLYTILEASYDVQGKIAQQQTRSMNATFNRWLVHRPITLAGMLKSYSALGLVLRTRGLDKQQFYAQASEAFDGADSQEVLKQIDYLYEQYVELYNKTPEQYMNYITQVVADEVFSKQVNTLGRTTTAKIECETTDSHVIEFENNEVKFVNNAEKFLQPIYITTSDLIDTVGNNKKLRSAQQTDSVSYANNKLVDLLMKEKSAKDFTIEEYECLQQQKKQMEIILQQVLEGDMHVEKGSLVYYDEWAGSNIAFGNVASGVRIFLILKKLLDNGVFLRPTFLIIDEPETNLHPEWQLRLAEFLVMLQRSMGIKIYANTHSPYFARAIEYYANKYGELEKCKFYLMKSFQDTGMYVSEDVTEKLGLIYDMLAEPFNRIM